MADIRCQGCDEPWDSHHLRHEAIHETSLPEPDCRRFNGRLTPSLRDHFESVGYRFGGTIFSLKSCPCCPNGARPTAAGRRRSARADVASAVLGSDLDGVWAEITEL